MGALDAPVQGESFYVEKINLASKLRVILEMELESAIFKQKVPSHIFRQQLIKISLFASLNTLNNFFLYKTQKQPIMSLSSQFQLYFTL